MYEKSTYLPTYLPTYLSIYLSIYLWLYSPFVESWPFFNFLMSYAVDRTSWTGDHPVARPLPAHRTAQTQNKHTQTFISLVEFETTIIVFGREKTVHALDRAAILMGQKWSY
jgi:hypothetical protein